MWVFSLNCGGLGPWTFQIVRLALGPPRLSQNDPREAQNAQIEKSMVPTRGHNSTRRPSESENKSENGDGRGETSAKFWASDSSASTFSGCGPLPLHPSRTPCPGPPSAGLISMLNTRVQKVDQLLINVLIVGKIDLLINC